MLNNFGGAYTLSSIDNESYQQLQYIQVCLSASEQAQKTPSKDTIFSKEFI